MSGDPIAAADRRFAERMELLRTHGGISRDALAARSGLTRNQIYEIERGKSGRSRRRVSIGEAVALAAALGVDLAELVRP